MRWKPIRFLTEPSYETRGWGQTFAWWPKRCQHCRDVIWLGVVWTLFREVAWADRDTPTGIHECRRCYGRGLDFAPGDTDPRDGPGWSHGPRIAGEEK